MVIDQEEIRKLEIFLRCRFRPTIAFFATVQIEKLKGEMMKTLEKILEVAIRAAS